MSDGEGIFWTMCISGFFGLIEPRAGWACLFIIGIIGAFTRAGYRRSRR